MLRGRGILEKMSADPPGLPGKEVGEEKQERWKKVAFVRKQAYDDVSRVGKDPRWRGQIGGNPN